MSRKTTKATPSYPQNFLQISHDGVPEVTNGGAEKVEGRGCRQCETLCSLTVSAANGRMENRISHGAGEGILQRLDSAKQFPFVNQKVAARTVIGASLRGCCRNAWHTAMASLGTEQELIGTCLVVYGRWQHGTTVAFSYKKNSKLRLNRSNLPAANPEEAAVPLVSHVARVSQRQCMVSNISRRSNGCRAATETIEWRCERIAAPFIFPHLPFMPSRCVSKELPCCCGYLCPARSPKEAAVRASDGR